jgi:predicted AAA+ superfamily ATPase
LSFDEYLAFKNQELHSYLSEKKENAKFSAAMLEKLYAYLEEYIVYGGYPRVLLSLDHEEKKDVLRNILNVYLLRDVRDLMGLGDDYKMISLMKALSLQTGNVISYQELSQITSLNFSSLKKNLNLLEKTYIIGLPKPFFTNKRIELVKNPKVYFYDTGLRNAVIDDINSCRASTAYRLSGSGLSQYGRMLCQRHGNISNYGQYLHARLPLL